MAKADYRTKARECYRMAAMAPSPADQATWLKLASEWLAMSSGRGVPVLTGSTVVKREAAQTTTSDDLLVTINDGTAALRGGPRRGGHHDHQPTQCSCWRARSARYRRLDAIGLGCAGPDAENLPPVSGGHDR
jgi:hypothetical protein